MANLRDTDKESALHAIADMIARAEKAQAKFAAGTAQHSLQVNRIHALRVAQALVSQEFQNGGGHGYAHADLARAKAPLASLISKSEKAQDKLNADSWQHQMLRRNLEALRLAAALLEAVCAET